MSGSYETAGEPKSALLTLAMGWAFWSFTTALAITAHLIAAKVATASAAWASLSELYHRTVHGIFGDLPALLAAYFALPKPDLTPSESSLLGLTFIFLLPYLTYLATHSRIKRTNSGYLVMAIWVVSGTCLWLVLAYAVAELNSISGFYGLAGGLVGFLGVCLYDGGLSGAWRFGKNLLGAIVILASLATTGIFSLT